MMHLPTGLKTTKTDASGRTVGVLTFSTTPLQCCSVRAVPFECRGSSREQPSGHDSIAGAHPAAALAASDTHLRWPGVAPGTPGNGEPRARAVAPASSRPRSRSRLCGCGVDREAAMPRVRIARLVAGRTSPRSLKPGSKGRDRGGR
jgi:hypothetical protein